MPAINVPLKVLRRSYPNMCGAVLHVPVPAELTAVTVVSELDELAVVNVADSHVARFCIADTGHDGDHVVWLPNGVFISAYETLPPGWCHEPKVARQIALWQQKGCPYPSRSGAYWV